MNVKDVVVSVAGKVVEPMPYDGPMKVERGDNMSPKFKVGDIVRLSFMRGIKRRLRPIAEKYVGAVGVIGTVYATGSTMGFVGEQVLYEVRMDNADVVIWTEQGLEAFEVETTKARITREKAKRMLTVEFAQTYTQFKRQGLPREHQLMRYVWEESAGSPHTHGLREDVEIALKVMDELGVFGDGSE